MTATAAAASPEAPSNAATHSLASGPNQPSLRELFPGVYADVQAHVVEIDATVSPMLVPDARAPRFYLEVLACAPSTREHETFFVIRAKPSHIHAAMLAAGFTPGSPGRIERINGKAKPVDATGERLTIRAVYRSKDAANTEIVVDPLEWVIDAESVAVTSDAPKAKEPSQPSSEIVSKREPSFLEHERTAKTSTAGGQSAGWVFAGSRLVERPARANTGAPAEKVEPPGEMYQADGTGVIIGLTTFGSEVIAWSRAISPDAVVQAPEWVADFSKTPAAGTNVRIRVMKEAAAGQASTHETDSAPSVPARPATKK